MTDRTPDPEVARARRAATENLHRNSGRDQASYEHAVDVAEALAKRRKSEGN